MTQPYRHPRRGLALPFVLVGLALAVWTGWWFFLAREVEARLDAQVAALRADGWRISHGEATIRGWPFRTRVALPRTEIAAPSGHGVSAPELVAEANAWNPGHWVVVAPDGLTLSRAEKGRVKVDGDGLRMSVSHLRARFPDLRLELIRPTFTVLPGSEPFPISAAERIQFEAQAHRRDPSADAVDFLFNLQDAQGRAGGPVEGATQSGRLTLQLEATADHASGLRGPDSAGVFANWSKAGGRFTRVRGRLVAGESTALMTSDSLAMRDDGRLEGRVSLTAERPQAAIAGLARSRSGAVNRIGAAGAAVAAAGAPRELVVDFRDGRTWLGPFALAPAPKLF